MHDGSPVLHVPSTITRTAITYRNIIECYVDKQTIKFRFCYILSAFHIFSIVHLNLLCIVQVYLETIVNKRGTLYVVSATENVDEQFSV